jgi:hypothetical protein
MELEELKRLILEAQKNGRITCTTAMEIADRTGTPRPEIGRLLNEMQIKVAACQLGCFK